MNEHADHTAVYFLVDPRTPEVVRYVGKAKTPRIRHLQHCTETASSPKGAWIESLREAGIFPQMQIIQWVIDADADKAEKMWIDRIRPDFLTNSSTVKAQKRKEPNKLAQALVSSDLAQTLSALQSVEREQIASVLQAMKGNKQEAARRLGIGRQTLYNKIKKYGIK